MDVTGIKEARERIEILERHIAYENDPVDFKDEWQPVDQKLSDRIAAAREIIDRVTHTTYDLRVIASITSDLRIDGHRADLVILKAARAHAAYEGRTAINDRDITVAIRLTIPHRLKRGPFNDAQADLNAVESAVDEKRQELGEGEEEGEFSENSDEQASQSKKKSESLSSEGEQSEQELSQAEAAPQDVFPTSDARWWEGGQQVDSRAEFETRKLNTQLDRMTRRQSGRRSTTRTDRKRGRYVRARQAGEKPRDIAFDATLRAAAPHQVERVEQKNETGMAYALRKSDLQEKVRVRKAANLIMFTVDASWSMAVSERMQATKGAIMSLLTDAYQRRDRVGLVVFQKDRASLVLPPTNSVVLAKQAMSDIPVGGKTPLSAGLLMTYEAVQREKSLNPDVMPMMILLTDGAGNVSISDTVSPQDEAHSIARKIHEADIRTVTINMEHVAFDQGLAQRLADQLGGALLHAGANPRG